MGSIGNDEGQIECPDCEERCEERRAGFVCVQAQDHGHVVVCAGEKSDQRRHGNHFVPDGRPGGGLDDSRVRGLRRERIDQIARLQAASALETATRLPKSATSRPAPASFVTLYRPRKRQ